MNDERKNIPPIEELNIPELDETKELDEEIHRRSLLIMEKYRETIMPGLLSTAAGLGRLGSSTLDAKMMGACRNFARELLNVAKDIISEQRKEQEKFLHKERMLELKLSHEKEMASHEKEMAVLKYQQASLCYKFCNWLKNVSWGKIKGWFGRKGSDD